MAILHKSKIAKMRADIRVPFPQELAFALKMQEQEFSREMLRLSIIKLYEMGKVSSGMAAKVLGCSRIDFLALVGQYQVSIFGEPSMPQLSEDFDHA
jgi:predicted HTH domain antitoxin